MLIAKNKYQNTMYVALCFAFFKTDFELCSFFFRDRQQFRYCEDQIRYHYTHDRSVLSSLRDSNPNYALATAQISTIPGYVEANAQLHREAIEMASNAAIDILIFPELSLTGYMHALALAPRCTVLNLFSFLFFFFGSSAGFVSHQV